MANQDHDETTLGNEQQATDQGDGAGKAEDAPATETEKTED